MHRVGRTAVRDEALVTVRAALAEALHVDGHFTKAASAWSTLSRQAPHDGEIHLKTAIAYSAAGLTKTAKRWLLRAYRAGAPRGDVLYVRAQHAWHAGEAQRASRLLTRAIRAKSGAAQTALGVLRWQAGATQEARSLFCDALRRSPTDVPARLNLIALDLAKGAVTDGWRSLLSESFSLEPHRPEPFVLLSRILRGDAAPAREWIEALSKARLRSIKGFKPQPTRTAAARGEACARVGWDGSTLRIQVLYKLSSRTRVLPDALRVNKGYSAVQIDGNNAHRRCSRAVRGEGSFFEYQIEPSAWRVDGDQYSLEVALCGVPVPPSARLEENWIELGSEARWLPELLPACYLNWVIEPDLPSGFAWMQSDFLPARLAPGMIALNGPDCPVRLPEGSIPVIGHATPEVLNRVSLVVNRAQALLSEEVGTMPQTSAPVVVLDRPNSTICYHRPGFTRVASGVMIRPGQDALLFHEIAHRVWGDTIEFAKNDRWLCEALSEYTLHIAERAGDLSGYAQASLQAVSELRNGRLLELGLGALSRKRERDAAYALRVKGGWVIAMLRHVIGDEAFRATLRTLVMAYDRRVGRRKPLDAYTFFAVASWHNKRSVQWFVNQWVHANATMKLQVERATVSANAKGYVVRATLVCRGVATPGAPVEVVVKDAAGCFSKAMVDVDLGRADFSILTTTQPVALMIDPSLVWFASIPEPRVVL